MRIHIPRADEDEEPAVSGKGRKRRRGLNAPFTAAVTVVPMGGHRAPDRSGGCERRRMHLNFSWHRVTNRSFRELARAFAPNGVNARRQLNLDVTGAALRRGCEDIESVKYRDPRVGIGLDLERYSRPPWIRSVHAAPLHFR